MVKSSQTSEGELKKVKSLPTYFPTTWSRKGEGQSPLDRMNWSMSNNNNVVYTTYVTKFITTQYSDGRWILERDKFTEELQGTNLDG